MPGAYSKIKTVISGETITASDRNAEHDNHINNCDFAGLGDYSDNVTQMRASTDPYPTGVESLATDGRGELERIRYLLTQITGKTYWYQDPVGSIESLVNGTVTIAGAKTFSGTVTLSALTADRALVTGVASEIAVSAVTATELGYVSGVTSAIQTQLGLKAPLASPTFTGIVTAAGLAMTGAITMAANKITGLGAGSALGDSVRYEQMKILQVVMATTVTSTNVTAAAFTNTALTASITPASASNKVLVLVFGDWSGDTASVSYFLTIKRDATNIGDAGAGLTSMLYQAAGTHRLPVSMGFLDSPASASAVTYTVQLKSNGTANAKFPSANAPTTVMILAEVNGV